PRPAAGRTAHGGLLPHRPPFLSWCRNRESRGRRLTGAAPARGNETGGPAAGGMAGPSAHEPAAVDVDRLPGEVAVRRHPTQWLPPEARPEVFNSARGGGDRRPGPVARPALLPAVVPLSRPSPRRS